MEAVVCLCVVLFAAGVLLPVWLLGGFRQTDLPVIDAGQTAEYGELRITVRSARLQVQSPGDATYLVIAADVFNKKREKLINFDQLVSLEQPVFDRARKPDVVTLASESSYGYTLPQRLSVPVELFWQVPDGATVPQRFELTLLKRSYQESFGDETYRWLDPEPWLRVRVRLAES